jgi:hypothetical protein
VPDLDFGAARLTRLTGMYRSGDDMDMCKHGITLLPLAACVLDVEVRKELARIMIPVTNAW